MSICVYTYISLKRFKNLKFDKLGGGEHIIIIISISTDGARKAFLQLVNTIFDNKRIWNKD